MAFSNHLSLLMGQPSLMGYQLILSIIRSLLESYSFWDIYEHNHLIQEGGMGMLRIGNPFVFRLVYAL